MARHNGWRTRSSGRPGCWASSGCRTGRGSWSRPCAGDTGAEWLAPLEQDYREAETAQAEVRRAAVSASPVAAVDYDPALLVALESQVLAFDSQATETLDQLRRALGTGAPPLLAEMDRLLMVYDFEAAAEQLPALREALRGSGG